MDGRELVFAALPFVVLIALSLGFLLVFRQRWAFRRGEGRGSRSEPRLAEPGLVTPPRDPGRATPRPRLGNPWLWIGVSAVFVVLGIFVWPGLFGGVFVFLPFVWVSRPRPPAMDPRGNGHSRREDGLA